MASVLVEKKKKNSKAKREQHNKMLYVIFFGLSLDLTTLASTLCTGNHSIHPMKACENVLSRVLKLAKSALSSYLEMSLKRNRKTLAPSCRLFRRTHRSFLLECLGDEDFLSAESGEEFCSIPGSGAGFR